MPVTDESSPPLEDSVYDAVRTTQFQPFEPEPVQPSPSPAPAEQGAFGGTSGADGEPHPQPQAEKPEHTEFDSRWKEPFIGLTYLGMLQSTFTLWRHNFTIRTLTTEEHAKIGQLVQPYEGTRSSNAVYQTAIVAASVVSVDGQPIVTDLSGRDASIQARYDYVSKAWHPAVREKIWDKVFELETEVREVLEELGKPSG